MKLFRSTKSTELLIKLGGQLQNKNMSQVLRECDCIYSHGIRSFNELEEEGLLFIEKQGREKLFTLTEKGREVAEHLVKIKLVMKNG